MSEDRTARIRARNDALRSTFVGGRVLTTSGVSALGPEAVTAVLDRVRTFTDFTEENDPNGEHDFGAFEIDGNRLFFKIDYYDPTMDAGSEDPSDPTTTTRVLTIMLASEY
jgi:hypothetical protein